MRSNILIGQRSSRLTQGEKWREIHFLCVSTFRVWTVAPGPPRCQMGHFKGFYDEAISKCGDVVWCVFIGWFQRFGFAGLRLDRTRTWTLTPPVRFGQVGSTSHCVSAPPFVPQETSWRSRKLLSNHVKAQNHHFKRIRPLLQQTKKHTNHHFHHGSLLFVFQFFSRWPLAPPAPSSSSSIVFRILSSLVSRFHQTSVLFALWHRWHRFVSGQRTLLTHFFSCLQLLFWGYLQPAHWPHTFFFSTHPKNERTVKRPKERKNEWQPNLGRRLNCRRPALITTAAAPTVLPRLPLPAPSHLLTLALTLLSQPPSDQSVSSASAPCDCDDARGGSGSRCASCVGGHVGTGCWSLLTFDVFWKRGSNQQLHVYLLAVS